MKNGIKHTLSKIKILKLLKTNFVFVREFYHDYHFYKNNYSYSKKTINKTKYNMLLIVHSLEKGLSNNNPRPFGDKKVVELIDNIKYLENQGINHDDYVFVLSINILRSYVDFYEKNNWQNNKEYLVVNEFLKSYSKVSKINSGSYCLKKEEALKNSNINYYDFVSSRHSIRNYSPKKLNKSDILIALKAAVQSPSACNRQMCKVYYVKNSAKRDEVINIGQGFGGFETENANIFLITFDVNANYFIGERNQGWFNSGLFAMNFINSLHSLGIGSCFVQFANDCKEEKYIKKILNIPSNERIAVIISAGYYADESRIPYSSRKSMDDVFEEIN